MEATYMDGFVVAVPEANRETYRRYAAEIAEVFLEHGAIRLVECWGDDVPDGKLTDFRRAVQAEAGEAIVFAWIEWPDRATRDAGMAKVAADPRAKPKMESMPFDGRRMIFGGFVSLVDARA